MTSLVPTDNAPLRDLHVPGERLGWTFRDRNIFRYKFLEPYPVPVPIPGHVLSRAQAARTKTGGRVAIALGVGTGIALLIGCCGAFSSTTDSGTAQQAAGGPQPTSGAALTDGFYVIAVIAFLAGLIAMTCVLVNSARAKAAVGTAQHQQMIDHQAACSGWEARRSAHEYAERTRVADLPEWGAADPAPGTRRIDIVGGSIWGWEAVLTVFGASLLSTRGAATVVDFTGEGACRELIRVAEATDTPASVALLPGDLARTNLLSGLSSRQLVDTLIEAMYGDTTTTGSRADRAQDDRILSTICTAVGEPVTIARVVAALRVLMDEPGGHDALTPAERQHIADGLFADEFKRQIHPNLRRIESYLHPLDGLSTEPVEEPGSGLTCLVEESDGRSARREMLKDVIVQWLIRQVSSQTPAMRSLVIAGADEVSHLHLERLTDLCERRNIRLVLLFRHLRDASVKALGGGSVAFMRLANHEEAQQAAEFIGRQHKFVLSNLTRSLGGNDTHSIADSVGSADTKGGGWGVEGYHSNWGTTRNWSQTTTRAEGSNWSDAATAQRAYEYSVEPRTLQDLPDYALLLVKGQGDSSVLQPVECNPAIVTLTRMSMQPLAALPLPDPRYAEIPLTGSPIHLALGQSPRIGVPGQAPAQAAHGVLPGWGSQPTNTGR